MTDPFVNDRIAYPHLLGLRDAIGDELAARGLPELCDTLIGVGAQVAFDSCSTDCGGIGWSRLASAYSSTANFPNADLLPVRGPLLMAETFELGVVRGIELPDDPHEGMDPDVLSAAAQIQMADMSAILAVMCGYFGKKGIPYIVGTYQPYGAEGACVGGWWQVLAQTGVAPKPAAG